MKGFKSILYESKHNKKYLAGIIAIFIINMCITSVIATEPEVHDIITEKVINMSDFVQNGEYKNYINSRIGCGVWVYDSARGGKENGDTYFALVAQAETGRFTLFDDMNGTFVRITPNGETSPIVWSMNIYPNNAISTIKFQTNGSLNIANDINVDTLGNNQWNNLTLVYYPENEDTPKHTDLYINGLYISSKDLSYDTAVYGTEFRFTVDYIDYTQNPYVFIDDLKFYRVSEFKTPTLIAENWRIENNTIYDYPNITVAEFYNTVSIPQGTTLEVLDIDGNIVPEADTISNGMTARVKYQVHELGAYLAQYRFSASKIHTVASFADENTLGRIDVVRAVKKIVYDVGGRSGAACKFETTGLTSDGARTIFTNIPITKENKSNVMMISVQVYVNDTIDAMYFATNVQAALSEFIFTPSLAQDQWNKLTLIYNPSDKTSKLYINDEYISSVTREIGDTVRLVINVGAEDFKDGYIYYDDFIINAGEITYPTVSVEDLVLDGVTINGYGTKTVSEFLSNNIKTNGEYAVKVYSPDGRECGANEFLNENNEIRIWSEDVPVDKYYIGTPKYKASDTVYIATNGYISESNKFGKGIVTITRNFDSYDGNMDITAIAAQYNNQGVLKKVSLNKQNLGINGKATVEIEIDDTENSYIKFMIMDLSDLKPFCDSYSFEPYSNDKIEKAARLFKGYTTKTAVFNYDDCRSEDIRLIELLDNYGMKGTFNLTVKNVYSQMKSACYAATGKDDEESVYNFVSEVYKNHEVSNHTVNHYPAGLNPGAIGASSTGERLVGVSTEEQIADITDCADFLKDKLNVNSIGLAWPNGYGTARDDYQSHLLPAMKACGIKYARGIETGTFAIPYDWYVWNPSCHHKNASAASTAFANLENKGDLKCLFIWGHTYEFGQNASNDKLNWNMIESVMKTISSANIWYATNEEIYRYIEAAKLAEVTDTEVINHSDMTIYYNVNGENVEIMPGDTYSIL